ncbi:MAG: hypothetical protein MZV65_16265 [Chromatiales bacterium]|nr:hypothetical protein [Chromatiales bacterium]
MEKWGKKDARFGWIEFVEDFDVARALLETVEGWARSKGMEGLVGPLEFTDLDREGMLVEGFQELSTLATIYNHPYYPEYLARLGYVKEVDWVEYEVRTPRRSRKKPTGCRSSSASATASGSIRGNPRRISWIGTPGRSSTSSTRPMPSFTEPSS